MPDPSLPLDHGAICDALAREHDQHVAWLQVKFPDRAPADLADTVQDGLTEFWRTSAARTFPTLAAARAYLRTLLRHRCIDRLRVEEGRRPGERERRPQPVPLDDPAVRLVADGEALGALHDRAAREHAAAAVGEAIARLKPDYARVLRRRYADDLDPASIATLESISLKQYEDRHTRAIKALGRALAGVAIDPGCERARVALNARARRGLMPFEADHVASCPACRAFRLTLRGRLALVPAPLFSHAVLALMRGSGARDAVDAPLSVVGHAKALLAKPVALVVAAAGIGAGGLAIDDADRRATPLRATPAAVRSDPGPATPRAAAEGAVRRIAAR